MEYFNNVQNSIKKKLDEKNPICDGLRNLEKKTNVPSIYLVYGLIIFIGLYLMVGYGGTFLANLIGFVYPAYKSIKAIESIEKDDDTKWLTYWVVYAVFSLLECFTDLLLFWIPLYAFMKCAFLIFLMMPGPMNGSCLLFNNVIKPFMDKYGSEIDEVINEGKDLAGKAKQKATRIAVDQLTKEQ